MRIAEKKKKKEANIKKTIQRWIEKLPSTSTWHYMIFSFFLNFHSLATLLDINELVKELSMLVSSAIIMYYFHQVSDYSMYNIWCKFTHCCMCSRYQKVFLFLLLLLCCTFFFFIVCCAHRCWWFFLSILFYFNLVVNAVSIWLGRQGLI